MTTIITNKKLTKGNSDCRVTKMKLNWNSGEVEWGLWIEVCGFW